MVDVRISWLQAFVAVAEERHFGRAASRLGHSASAVSRHVRHLEVALGRPVFERTTRRVALTPTGRRLYRDVATQIDALGRALRESAGAASTVAPTVVLGFVGAAAEHLVPDLAWQWSRRTDIELQLVPASSAAQLQAVEEGTMDVGLQWSGPRDRDLEVTHLLTEPMRVAVPVTHRVAGEGVVGMADLADDTWLMAADRTDLVVREHLTRACVRHGFVPRIKDAATGHAAQLPLVAAGMGVSLVPRTAIPGCRVPVSFARVAGEHVDLVAVTRRNPRPAAREIVDVLRASATLEPWTSPGDGFPPGLRSSTLDASSVSREEAHMHAKVGDRIIVKGNRVGQPDRDGEVLEARGPEGTAPFQVRWADGQEGLFFPGPDAAVQHPQDADHQL